MADIEQTARLTSKGQTTVPKAVRQALGLAPGDRVTWQVTGNRVVLTKSQPTEDHADPAIRAFLAFLERDIRAGNLGAELPPDLAEKVDALLAMGVDPEEEIEGDTVL